MKHRLSTLLPSLIGVLLFILALAAVHHELKGHTFAELLEALGHIRAHKLVIGGILAVLTYLTLTTYDTLASRQ